MAKKKLITPTFEVTYWDDRGEEKETLLVRPVSFDKLADITKLQEQLISHYVEAQGCLSLLLGSKPVKTIMVKLSKMLPVIGQPETGFDIEPLYISGDIIQLGKIFFSESIDENMRSPGIKDSPYFDRPVYHFPDHRLNPVPSAIARIHDMPFFEKFQKLRDDKIQEEQEKIEKEQLKALEVENVT